MCIGAPKVSTPAPTPVPDRVAEVQPTISATTQQVNDQVKRRAGYAAMILTPPQGLGTPSVGKTMLGS